MKKLSIVLLTGILALTFCFTGAAYAQGDEELQFPNPGITPDSSFYFADIWGERIGLFFAFGAEAKVPKALQYAEERLAEVDAMLAQNKMKAVTKATNEYNHCLAVATQAMHQAGEKGIDTTETVALATAKHIRFFGNVPDNVSENAKGLITQTRERAHLCQETALRALAQEDPERAIRMNLRLMEEQLNSITLSAEEGETLKLQGELQEFERLNNLGQEISRIAKGLGKDTTNVDRLVGQATANHLQVLAEVHERVQVQAQGAVESAMQVCVENHERIVTELKERNMLGEISENPPIPEGISDEVKKRILKPEEPVRGRS